MRKKISYFSVFIAKSLFMGVLLVYLISLVFIMIGLSIAIFETLSNEVHVTMSNFRLAQSLIYFEALFCLILTVFIIVIFIFYFTKSRLFYRSITIFLIVNLIYVCVDHILAAYLMLPYWQTKVIFSTLLKNNLFIVSFISSLIGIPFFLKLRAMRKQ